MLAFGSPGGPETLILLAIIGIVLYFAIVIAIIRWVLRVNTRVRLLEEINQNLEVLIEQGKQTKGNPDIVNREMHD